MQEAKAITDMQVCTATRIMVTACTGTDTDTRAPATGIEAIITRIPSLRWQEASYWAPSSRRWSVRVPLALS